MNYWRSLAFNDCLMVNKRLIKIFGTYGAILLTELANCYTRCKNNGELDKEIFFFTVKEIEENTGLDESTQKKELWKLKRRGILEDLSLGLSVKKYFRFNEEALEKLITGK